MFSSFQQPPAQVPYTGKPPCWGLSFDETNRECRGCGFQNSCKEHIIRENSLRAPQYGRPEAPRYAAPVPAPIPVPVAPWQPQPTRFPLAVMQPTPVPVARQPDGVAQQSPVVPHYGYGWVNDPLFNIVHSAPPLMRPQLAGERFMERVVKNAALSMLESFMSEMFLAVRQMIWAPEPRREKVIDVTPGQQQ